MFVKHRYHQCGKRLTHADIHLTAQCEHHRRDILGEFHPLLKLLVALSGYREQSQMNRCSLVAESHRSEVSVKAVGEERRNRSHEQCDRLKARIQGLISREFILIHFSAPEAFAVEAHIPVAEIVIDKIIYGAGSLGGLVIVKRLLHFTDESGEE